VVIEERAHLLTRTQDEAIRAAEAAGHTGSAADELIAERRAEAAQRLLGRDECLAAARFAGSGNASGQPSPP
jgi:hypothetical protein